jgi:hypothetical protein
MSNPGDLTIECGVVRRIHFLCSTVLYVPSAKNPKNACSLYG